MSSEDVEETAAEGGLVGEVRVQNRVGSGGESQGAVTSSGSSGSCQTWRNCSEQAGCQLSARHLVGS